VSPVEETVAQGHVPLTRLRHLRVHQAQRFERMRGSPGGKPELQHLIVEFLIIGKGLEERRELCDRLLGDLDLRRVREPEDEVAAQRTQ